MRVFDLTQNRWRVLSSGSTQKRGIHARFAHSMNLYDNGNGGKWLVIFGGAGSYIQSIKMRLSFNDLHVFDT